MLKVGFKETKSGVCTFFFDSKMYQYLGVNGLREAKREARKFFDLKGVDIKWEKLTYYYLSFVSCEACYTRCFITKKDRESFKKNIGGHLSISSEWLEKQMEIYNQWLYDSNLEQYELYENDNDGLETLLERNFIMLPTPDIINELVGATHYDIYDSLVTFDYEDGFRSLTEEEIKERFESKDFLDWLEGQRLGDYDVI